MLASIRLTNFKSFRAAEAIPLAPLTLCVGANASGKSNLFDAIRFLQGIGLKMSLADVLHGRWEGGHQVWPGIRGGLQEVARAGENSFALQTAWDIGRRRLTHEIECRTNGQALLEREVLVSAGEGDYLFNGSTQKSGAVQVMAGVISGRVQIPVAIRPPASGESPVKIFDATRSLIDQIVYEESIHPTVILGCDVIEKAMASALFLDIQPSMMRGYAPKAVDHLGLHGENVSASVWKMCQDAGSDRKADLLDWLSELCAPRLKDISFIETGLGEVMLQLIEDDDSKVSARSLSDGTLRFLGILTALLTAPEHTLVLIEEVENGLHPTRVRLLTEILESAASKRNVQVLATSHSPTVLRALSAESLGAAVVFGRLPDGAGTVMRRLKDLPQFSEIVERRGIEDLFTTGWLERAL